MSKKKTLQQIMRALHRDIGFFLIGITIIYCISGIVLTYRDRGWLRYETIVENNIQPRLSLNNFSEINRGRIMVRDYDGENIYFMGRGIKDGKYHQPTGKITYKTMQYPYILSKFNQLHLTSGRSPIHFFTALYGVLLAFLAISSFWMYKPGSKMLKRGIYLSIAGVVASILLMIV